MATLCGTAGSWFSNSIVKAWSAGAARQSLANFLSLAEIDRVVPSGLHAGADSAAATAGTNNAITTASSALNGLPIPQELRRNDTRHRAASEVPAPAEVAATTEVAAPAEIASPATVSPAAVAGVTAPATVVNHVGGEEVVENHPAEHPAEERGEAASAEAHRAETLPVGDGHSPLVDPPRVGHLAGLEAGGTLGADRQLRLVAGRCGHRHGSNHPAVLRVEGAQALEKRDLLRRRERTALEDGPGRLARPEASLERLADRLHRRGGAGGRQGVTDL